jgi:mono/diheme cytochrome c family protein
MARRRGVVVVMVLVAMALAVIAAVLSFDLSALNDPSATEAALAHRAKKILTGRASRSGVPAESAASSASGSQGEALFGVECSLCHGASGRAPTDIGKSMYPRVPDLGSPEVQDYTDAELFWIIKNGIRLSGMPGFGRAATDVQIWQIARFVRSLRNAPTPPAARPSGS